MVRLVFNQLVPLPSLAVESRSSNSNLIIPKKNHSLSRQDELPSVKPAAFRRNMSNNSVEHNNTKKKANQQMVNVQYHQNHH